MTDLTIVRQLCYLVSRMKNKRKQVTKDVRVVVRVEESEANWLVDAAKSADASVGYVIRRAIRKLRTQVEAGRESFNNGEHQFATAE